MENKPLMQKLNERADIRRAKRKKRRDARHQSKIMTTTYDSPLSQLETTFIPGHGVEKHSQTVESLKTTNTNRDTGEVTQEDTVNPFTIDHGSEILEDRPDRSSTSGDYNKYGNQNFDVSKIYKGADGKYNVKQKASMTKTTPADKSFGFGVTSNTGTQLNIKKYNKHGVVKRDKTFEVKGSGWRDEGGAGDTRVSEDREKGVKYISQKRMDRKQSRFMNKYNQRAGYGSRNLAQGGEGTSGTDYGAVSGVNLTAEQRKQKAESDRNTRKNTHAKKAAAAKESGTSGTTYRYVKRRNRRAARKNK
jgi:hypothetical protein